MLITLIRKEMMHHILSARFIAFRYWRGYPIYAALLMAGCFCLSVSPRNPSSSA